MTGPILARLRRGEEQAFRSLIRRCQLPLVGVATAIIGSRAQSEEVVQDAWLAVFTGIDRFEHRSNLVTWVFSIMLSRGALPRQPGGAPGRRSIRA